MDVVWPVLERKVMLLADFSFPDHFTKVHQEVHYPRNSGFLVEEINSEQVSFPEYSIIQQKVSV